MFNTSSVIHLCDHWYAWLGLMAGLDTTMVYLGLIGGNQNSRNATILGATDAPGLVMADSTFVL